MSSFFKDFNKVSKHDWADKIHADLRGKDPSLLKTEDTIEELKFNCFYHAEDQKRDISNSARGIQRNNNNWNNGIHIEIESEAGANTQALKALMNGADMIWFRSTKVNTNWEAVLQNIKVEYIKLQISANSFEDIAIINKLTDNSKNIQFNMDTMSVGETIISTTLKNQSYLLVNGFSVQQAGATTWQEIAYCLNAGHEYLLQLMDSGLTIDQACESISFHVGVGSNYFYEIAKIRALRDLWAKIVRVYNPANDKTYSFSITAVIGHTNKSLSDPHTNLLRQTTESMSALSAGVDSIVVLPHDMYSESGASELAQRMALNISLVLREESYFGMVVDPLGGSYTIEQLTSMIGEKAWNEFQHLEKEGGLLNQDCRSAFAARLNTKREARISQFMNNEHILIGINKFMNPAEEKLAWAKLPSYLGVEALNFESLSKIASV
ncbi:MAG: methylmalonyl-CoA mutase family protein [Crocinitomicaceae bacterium]|nr:methylmalonyl-CoA mutase family protein [Crocinitomicaceae bacterium]MDG2441507.1 methylmalonyl-CoA mutase family protein [Crocinitomicaceae bacterium]